MEVNKNKVVILFLHMEMLSKQKVRREVKKFLNIEKMNF